MVIPLMMDVSMFGNTIVAQRPGLKLVLIYLVAPILILEPAFPYQVMAPTSFLPKITKT